MDLGALYRGIVETSLDGIWVFDGDGRTLHANQAIADLLGLAADELSGLTLFDPLDAAGCAQMAEHLRDLARGEVNESEVECLWHRRDGTQLWVLVRESALYDEHGALLGYLHRVSDWSERRRLFEELERNRTMLAEAQRIAKVGSWEWDLCTGRITASDELHVIYAVPREEFAGTYEAFVELVHPDDRHIVDEAVQAAMEGADTFDFVARVHRGDGGLVWTRGRGEIFRDRDGAPVWARGTHQDITDAKETELALEDLVAQNALMQAVATAANESETLVDVLAVAQPLLVRHDDWFRGRGYVPDPARPGSLLPLHIDRSEREADAREPERTAREHALAMQVLRERRQVWDEQTVPEQPAVGFPVKVGSDLVAICVITASTPFERQEMIRAMIDQVAVQLGRVAEREHAAQELAAARDAAMAASRQKSEFLAAMSHEIRTPLNGVIGLNDLLLRTELDPHQHRLATGAQVASRALLGVINDILDFSKIEAGKLEVEHVDFEVRTVFDQVASVLAESARSAGIELLVSCHPDVPEWLNGDPTRLAQVLTNLGSNAVKFTQEGGEVSIRAVSEEAPDGSSELRVEVLDTGIGIDPERIEHLFAPFTQADTSTTRQYGGTGLGLAISSKIVAALGGRIGAEARADKGSRFWFTARCDRAGRPVPDTMERLRRDALAGRKVLVVDDNANNRLILSEHLGRWDVCSTTASSVAAALESLRSAAVAGRPFDAVLLDLAMPGRDGMDLAVEVSSDPALGGTTMIMLSSMDGPDEVTLREVGIVECLTKPVLAGDLHKTLLRALGEEVAEAAERPAEEASTAAPGERPRLLVVEDNPVNQLVALGILETLGYAADTVDDGEEAVEAWRDGDYAAVLMDVQMPRMDGYAATRAIRSLEPEGERVPVLAMTAAAVEGEREKCLAAGMDDFLTKPVNPEALGAMLQRWARGPVGRKPAEHRSGRTDGVLDLDRLDMLRDLDPASTAYLDRAIANFIARAPDAVASIGKAVAAEDSTALTEAAHRLKGSALNLGMPAVGHLAYELEMLGDGGRTAGAEALLVALEEALDQAVTRVRDYQRGYQEPTAVRG
jgi:PAS domain S-box-containing protein